MWCSVTEHAQTSVCFLFDDLCSFLDGPATRYQVQKEAVAVMLV